MVLAYTCFQQKEEKKEIKVAYQLSMYKAIQQKFYQK